MNVNIIPTATFIKKIRCCDPCKIMNFFCMKSDNTSFIFVIIRTSFFKTFKPLIKILASINTDFFPSWITSCNNSCRANNISFGYIHRDIIGTKLSVKFTFGMERFIKPSILIINRHTWVPLCKIILLPYSPCSF